jgi:serine/threonine protein kinase/formylglycine-generating enzyme required for sulfatase activity
MTEEQVFLAALELPNVGQRSAYLDTVCGADTELRRQVEELLAAHFKSGDFLNEPVGRQLAAGSATPTIAETLYVDGNSEREAMASEQKPAEGPDDLFFLLPSTRPDSLGRIGHYEMLQVLGKGGFGIVFRAFDDILQRVVALKVLAPAIAATSPARKRFLREAQASARVRHENVVQVHAVEELPTPYLVMEFIAGETLQQRLDRKGPLSTAEIVSLGRQIAEGLAAAHATGLIHRDIKPGNILIEGGSSERVKITDFGLARAADDASMTQSGVVAGTPMFMAPEQAQGETLDQRADLFSLGSVLYVMASGRPPFRAATTFAVLKRVVEETPRPITEVIPETPQWLCDIIARLHAKKPGDRFQSAREVADVLADCEAQLKHNSKLSDYTRIPRGTSARDWARQKWAVLAAAIALFAVITVAQLEFAGITNWFRARQPEVTIGPIRSTNGRPTPANRATGQADPATDGFVQLFNGKDLTGWKFHPGQRGDWEVKDGILRGSKRQSHLFSERGDYVNFHVRVEVKVNLGGDSGLLFRAPFELRRGRTPYQFGITDCYEVELHQNRSYLRPTGSISEASGNAPPETLGQVADGSLTQPDEWFTIEVIAENDHFITKINGIEAVNCDDLLDRHQKGHLALQVWHPNTIVQFRKIEIKELPARAQTPPSAVAPFDATQALAHQKAWAKHLGVPVEYVNTIDMKFVLIPPGEFIMGSTAAEIKEATQHLNEDKHWRDCLNSEGPQHKVVLTQPFYLGVYEVTQSEYEQMMGKNPSSFATTGPDKLLVDKVQGLSTTSHPVESVSWNDAAEFCATLSEHENHKPYYFRAVDTIANQAGTGYRLPTEAEWELACRAGTTTKYWFGDSDEDLIQRGWFDANSSNRTHAIGTLKANPFGLHDVHGNTWELVQDWWDLSYYREFQEKPALDPRGPSSGSQRVLRGGNFASLATGCRSSNRNALPPANRSLVVGFRVLLTVEAVKKAK